MTEQDLLALIDEQEALSRDYADDVAKERAENIQAYYREPYGDEEDGRSSVISSDVADTINQLLPSLIEMFTGSESPVEFVGRGAEDQEMAEQATDSVRYVFETQNNGFLIYHQWFHDALLIKNGVVTWYAEKKKLVTEEIYKNLDDDELGKLLIDDSVEIAEHEQRQEVQTVEAQPGMPQQVMVNRHDVKVRKVSGKNKITIDVVPQEELLVSARARSADIGEADFVRHERPYTKTELIGMGFDKEVVENLPVNDSVSREDWVALTRRQRRGYDDDDVGQGLYWYRCYYMRVDFDDDGIPELRKVSMVGKTILENIVIDEINLASITPRPNPHEYYGECPADDAKEFQRINTVLLRNTLDSLYQSVNPRWQVVNGQVDLDALMASNRPGGVVTMNAIGQAQPLLMPFIGQQTFPLLEYIDSRRELRTNVHRYQGVDVGKMNMTATGAQIMNTKDEMGLKLIARSFAEIGVKRLFRGILKLLAQTQQDALNFRLRNKNVSIDPRVWSNEYDLTVNVGMSVHNKGQQLAMLQQIAGAQMAMLPTPAGMMISPKNLYNSQAKIAELAGWKNPALFFTDPDTIPPKPQQPPPPDPRIVVEQMRQQANADQSERDRQFEAWQTQMQEQNKLLIEQMGNRTSETVAAMRAYIDEQSQVINAQAQEMRAQNDQLKTQLAVVEKVQGLMPKPPEEQKPDVSSHFEGLQKQLAEAMEQLSSRIEGARTVGITRVRGADGKLVGGRVQYADGTSRDVPIQ